MDITQEFVDLLWRSRNFGLTIDEWKKLKLLCNKTIEKADFHLKES